MKKTYKINFKSLETLERKLKFDNPTTLEIIKNSLNQVINYVHEPLYLAPSNVEMCINSLKDLNIIVETNKEENSQIIQQLNS